MTEKGAWQKLSSNKSGGCRKIRKRVADGYLGLSKRNILKVT